MVREAARAFGRDGKVEPLVSRKFIGYGIGEQCVVAAVDRNAAKTAHQTAKRKGEPLFFHQKTHRQTQGALGQHAVDKIPIASVWRNANHRLGRQRCIAANLPTKPRKQTICKILFQNELFDLQSYKNSVEVFFSTQQKRE